MHHTRSTAAAATAIVAAMLLSGLGQSAASAAAPDPAALVGPANGSTTASVTPSLSVVASDSDGGGLTVRFEGRELGATVPGASDAEPFTFVVVPDTQNYSYANEAVLDAQLEWVRDSRGALNTVFVSQVGDLVSEWDNPRHWANVSPAFGILDDAGVPNTVVPGNHDFDSATGDVSAYNAHFPPSRYADAAWSTGTTRYGGYLGQDQFGADEVDRGNADSYALFTAGGRDFLLLNLEWEAPQYALDWAERVLDAHPERTVIMATHSFLTVTGSRLATAQRPSGTSTAALWQDFVRTNCQIRLVVAGHAHQGGIGEAQRTDDNACGQPVHQILSNYQEREAGGNGWLRYYTFDPAANTMRATTYSPYLDQHETDADSSFTLPFELTPAEPAPFAAIATRTVTAGAVASTSWPGLRHDTEYEWRVIVDDGESTSTSPTWTLRTPPEPRAVLAADTFERTTTNGWGSADVGGTWATSGGGSSAPLSVSGGQGMMALIPTQTRVATLTSVSSDDTVTEVQLSSDVASAGGAAHATIVGRQVGSSSYALNVRFETASRLRLYLLRNNAALATWTSSWSPGQLLTARLSVTGTSPTRLGASVWPSAGAEPAAWQLTATDSTAGLQSAGVVAVKGAVSSASSVPTTRLAFDDYLVVSSEPAAEPTPNTPPTASFTTTVTGSAVTADATASTDSDGTIAAYAWRFGDGGTATGPTAEHTYAAAGTYTVELTVTDDDGASSTATRTVSIDPAPPPEPPDDRILAADAFERTATNGWGSADAGGPWTTGGGSAAFSVGAGTGAMALAPSSTREARLDAVATTDAVVTVRVSTDSASAGGAASATVIGRLQGSAVYAARLRLEPTGALRLYLLRNETALGRGSFVLPGAYVPGEPIMLRLSVSGTSPTTLGAMIWRPSGPEPLSWQLQATDSTAALQAPGVLAIRASVSSSSTVPSTRMRFDDYRAVSGSGP